MSNSAVDRDRLEAYQRKMNNPAEMLVGNVVIGSMIGMFVGYMSGAAFGVYKWKRECPSRRRNPTASMFVHSSRIETHLPFAPLCKHATPANNCFLRDTIWKQGAPKIPRASLRSHASPPPPSQTPPPSPPPPRSVSVGAKTTSLGAGIGILVGGAVNGYYTLQKGGSASNFRAADLQQPKRKGVTELQQDLEYIRQRERETGESMERQKKVVKSMLANEEKMAAMMRRQ
jgi:hypothetical protein